MPSKEWTQLNRESINEKRRHRYQLNKEKPDWPEKLAKYLQKKKEAKTLCPHCNILYGNVYLKHHIALRHRIPISEQCVPIE